MNTLHIDRNNTTISQQRGAIRISIDGRKPKTIPLSQINRVVVSSSITLESRLLRTLASRDISLALLNPRKPEEYGLLIGSGHNDAGRRIRQIKASEDPNFCQRYARYLGDEKMSQQKKLVENARCQRPEHRYSLTKAYDTLDKALSRLRSEALNLDSIRGIAVTLLTSDILHWLKKDGIDPQAHRLKLRHIDLLKEITRAIDHSLFPGMMNDLKNRSRKQRIRDNKKPPFQYVLEYHEKTRNRIQTEYNEYIIRMHRHLLETSDANP